MIKECCEADSIKKQESVGINGKLNYFRREKIVKGPASDVARDGSVGRQRAVISVTCVELVFVRFAIRKTSRASVHFGRRE